jgi:hypothetical protein
MISPKLDTFKQIIESGKGISRPYDFEIILPVGGGSKLSGDNIKDMNATIRSFTLPARTSAKQSVYYGGPLRQFPYISTYDGEINMTFIMRREDPLLIALHAWQESAIPTDTRTLQYQDDYTTDMDLIVRRYVQSTTSKVRTEFEKDKTTTNNTLGVPVGQSRSMFNGPINTIKYSLRDVWCESIGAVQMSNESANEPLLFNVVLCYREFKTSAGQNEAVSDRVMGPLDRMGPTESVSGDGRGIFDQQASPGF